MGVSISGLGVTIILFIESELVQMANGVNTEWFDLQVKFGNYLPKEKEATLAEIQLKAQKEHEEANKLENQLDKKDMEGLNDMEDDLDFDDEFMREYMAKRRNELEVKAKNYKYGEVKEISRNEYVREVTEADPESFVVLHLYQNSNEFCGLINERLPALARSNGHVKFVKIISNKCIENFPDSSCPCFIIYKAGKPVSHVTNVDKHMKGDINNLPVFLSQQGLNLE